MHTRHNIWRSRVDRIVNSGFLPTSILVVLLISGCATKTYSPEPVTPEVTVQQLGAYDLADPAFRVFLQNHAYPVDNWPLERLDLTALTLAAWYFNPAMHVARSGVEVERAGEVIAGQRTNPTLNFPDEPRDTLDFFGLVGDFLFERAAKREARQAEARAWREASELALTEQAWTLYANIHLALIEYYAAVRTSQILSQQEILLEEAMTLLKQRLRAGQVNEFEVSSMRIELQRTQLMLSNQRYASNDAYHQLVGNTGLHSDKFRHAKMVYSDLQQHLQENAETINALQPRLLHSRIDIRRKLAEYNAFEARLRYEIESQYPDITLSPGIVFERGQSLWVLAGAWVLPVFHNNDGQIQQALAERRRKQFEFMQLQAYWLNKLERTRQNYLDRLAAYQYSQQLLDAVKGREKQIEKQFELGYSDRLDLLRSRLETVKAKQAMLDIELDVMRAAAALEETSQTPMTEKIGKLDFIQPDKLTDIVQ